MLEPAILENVTDEAGTASDIEEALPETRATETDAAERPNRWATAFDAEMRLWLDANRWKF